MPRLPTGVAGFDAMVQGGLPVGSSVVLQGPPGQEKLRFALIFLAEGLKSGGSGLVVTSSQSPEAVIAELRELGVNLDSVTNENRLRVVDWYSWSEETVQDIEDRGIVIRSSVDLTNLGVALSRAIAALTGGEPRRAVIELLSPATSSYEVTQVYAFAQSAKRKFDRHQFTSLVLLEKEMHSGAQLTTLHQPFDGVIEIERTRSADRIVRKIGVLHLKDTAPDPTFRVLEISEAGMRVVLDAPKPVAPGSTARGSVLESQDERGQRLRLILQIATERLKLNPGDADALFAMAEAQATLDDAKGGLETLDRLAALDSAYPGLWVLKTKLHAKLGQSELAQKSRLRALQSEPEAAKAIDATVPCPMCEAPIALDATSCANCGVKFTPTRTLEDELDDLGNAAIQEMVREDLGAAKEAETGLEKPAAPEPKPKSERPIPPSGTPTEKAPSKKGLTNGLVLGRRGAAKAGRTNGLRSRTNGLRGRTNGLTNGLGRTNGLTNGVGRTNGLTNGLGRTNGLTNGLGGFRSGGFRPAGVHRMMQNAGWKLYLIPLVSVALLLLPLFFVPEYGGPAYPIRIDGQFADWNGIPRLTLASAAVNANIDITRVAVTDNIDFLSFYAEVRGRALQGDPSPARTMDAFFVFIDADGSAATGYRVQGLGADRLIQIEGWGGQIVSATLMEFDSNRDSNDWGGWFKATPVSAAASGNQIEFEASWDGIVLPKRPIEAAFAARSWDGSEDIADATASSLNPFVVVRQQTGAPQLLASPQADIAAFTFDAVGGDVAITWINVTLTGTYRASTFSSFALVDAVGNTLAQSSVMGSRLDFGPLSRSIPGGGSLTARLRPSVNNNDGTTVGAFLKSPMDIIARSAGVSLVGPLTAPTSLAYVGVIPSIARIDGGFAEWTNTTADAIGDMTPPGTQDVDISRYSFASSGGNVTFMVQTVGTVLNGTLVPVANRVYSGTVSSPADTDRDGVPDSVDTLPNDFNNDGIPDAATNGDYDGDGLLDYGYSGGLDYWLNTTIPATFPVPYAGRAVTVYIGPVQRPFARGEDVARFYLDRDGSSTTGYAVSVLGADYLVEVRGKEGQILSSESFRFNGSSPGQWSWDALGSANAEKDGSRIEAELGGAAITNASRASFELTAWGNARDEAAGAQPLAVQAQLAVTASGQADAGSTTSSGPHSIHTLDISGNEKWFFTSSSTDSTDTSCTSKFAASTTAGSSATSTGISTDGNSICWFTPAGQPASTVAGPWEVILEISKVDATKAFLPNAQGTYNDFKLGLGCTAGSEYQCADEHPNDGDVSYIRWSGIDKMSSYNIPDWASPPNPFSVSNVNITIWCNSGGAGASAATLLVNGSNTLNGTIGACPNTNGVYGTVTSNYANYPWGTARAWTSTDINNLEIGLTHKGPNNREIRLTEVRLVVTYAPVYSVEIFRCQQQACTSGSSLYGPTNSAAFGSDVTINTGTIAAQSLAGGQRIRFKLVLVTGAADGGSITIRYSGVSGGSDDSRATIPIPEFNEIITPATSIAIIVVLAVHRRRRRQSVVAGALSE